MGYFVIPWAPCCEAAASDAALMGNLVQQMVETVVTDEAEAAQRLKETDCQEAAGADAAEKRLKPRTG